MSSVRLASRPRGQGHDPVAAGDVALLSATDIRVIIRSIVNEIARVISKQAFDITQSPQVLPSLFLSLQHLLTERKTSVNINRVAVSVPSDPRRGVATVHSFGCGSAALGVSPEALAPPSGPGPLNAGRDRASGAAARRQGLDRARGPA
jgi:hypothetical protein